MRRVYDHIVERLGRNLLTGRDNRGQDYPPSEIAHAVDMSESDVRRALKALVQADWLRWQEKDGQGKQYRPAHFICGAVAPLSYEGERD